MRSNRSTSWTALIVCAAGVALACIATVAPTPARGAEETAIMIVVHAKVPERALDRGALQSIFMRRQRHWSDGVRIVPLGYAPGEALRERFEHVVIGLSPDQIARHFIDLRIREGIDPPRAVPSPQLALRVVPALPGSVAYLPAAQVPKGARLVARIVEGKVQTP